MTEVNKSPKSLNEEKWKPKFHFFKHQHWLNDPNGLVFINGKFHLFFQMNPDDVIWGNMHWGHAVSSDLVNWREKSIALYANPENLGYVFSGGAVLDKSNTSGFGDIENPPIVATFTHHSMTGKQVQSIAYSIDGAESFIEFEGNPVIENPGLKDFRDPKVIWHDASNCWVMVLVAGQCAQFYRSDDLKQWEYLSTFSNLPMDANGIAAGSSNPYRYTNHDYVWECPDLLHLHCKKTGESKWVLLISINPGGPNGGSAMQYFIGDFDGVSFTPVDDDIRWLDYGTDCYAGITFDNYTTESGNPVMIAWMSNWRYANQTPTQTWRGAMTLPRELRLDLEQDKAFVKTYPVVDLSQHLPELRAACLNTLPISVTHCFDLNINLEFNEQSNPIKMTLSNSIAEKVVLSLNFQTLEICIDRTQAGFAEDGFASMMRGPLDPERSKMSLRIIKDSCSIEVFYQQGGGAMTALLFNTQPLDQLKIDGDDKILRQAEYILRQCENA